MSLATLPAPPPVRRDRTIRAVPTFAEIGCGYRPGRTLGFSVIAHQLVFFLIIFFSRYLFFEPMVIVKTELQASRPSELLLLPTLGGGSEGGGRAGGGHGKASKLTSGMPAQSRRGFAYPGAQPIVSNPPRAVLGIQTILQPSIRNLRRLHQYVPLPDIVRPPPVSADAGTKPAPIVVKRGTLSFRRPAERAISAPRLKLPVAPQNEIADVVKSKPTIPRKAIPSAVEVHDITGVPKDQNGLLVLNAVPPPPDVTNSIPRAEARSLFAVTPGDATVIAAPAAGTKSGGQASVAAGSGNSSDTLHGDALAEGAAGATAGTQISSGAGTGSGGRYGNGQGSGGNSDVNGRGAGRGVASGRGIGTGSAPGTGSGAGAGRAPGTGSFPGISIQGGRYGHGLTEGMPVQASPRRQNSYSMSIVSTSSSGGGLPDLGIFHDEKVYTVFLDMRATEDDPAPSWTLQYAVLQPAPKQPGDPVARIRGTPTPPYATLKDVPEFPPDLVRKYGRRLIIASAILDTSGKLEQVSVKQTPVAQFTAPLVEALQHWLFQPAQIDGQPVALKILLGIRLQLPQ